MNKLRTGPWNLTDLKDVKPNGMKVFSCFHCGGGSTMGYKLAGYEVLGGVEIDPEMSEIYVKNHKPKYEYLMGVQKFKNIPDDELPKELFNLDILDGSPPCSSFSMSGSREKKWGKKNKFREGQAEQVLDDLFFDFIDIANKLKPKVVVAENVKGLLQGNARGYVKQIFNKFKAIGYDVQLFLLNSAAMGVPQRRERIFFIANKIRAPKLTMEFNEKPIAVKTVINTSINKKYLSRKDLEIWKWCKNNNEKCGGKAHTKLYGKRARFNVVTLKSNEPSSTLIANLSLLHWDEPRHLTDSEVVSLSSFPLDYKCKKIKYVCGMSVPPFMMQRISYQIYKQWLLPYKNKAV